MRILFVTFFILLSSKLFGQIDPTFGVNGHLNIDVNQIDNLPDFIKPTLDNGFIISTLDINEGEAYLIKYKSDGSIDYTFSNGFFYYDFPGNTIGSFFDIIQQEDSSYLVFGNYGFQGTSGINIIIKLDKNGILNNSYNVDGKIIYSIPSFQTFGRAAMIDSNEKILVAGGYETTFGMNNFYLTRFDNAGFIDTSFATNGIIKLTILNNSAFLPKLIFRKDSLHYMLIGWQYNNGSEVYFIQFNNNGSLDSLYGTNGFRTLSGFDKFSLAHAKIKDNCVYLTGGLAISGTQDSKSAIIKTDLDVNPNLLFGNNGIDSNLINTTTSNVATSLQIDANNQLLISGTILLDTPKFMLLKRDANSNPITMFGNNGIAFIGKDSSHGDFGNLSCILNDDSWIIGGHFITKNLNQNFSYDQDMTFCKVAAIYPSLLNNQIKKQCIFYPNPTKNKLYYDDLLNISSLSVYQLDGRLITRINNISNQNNYLDVSSLAPNTYFIIAKIGQKYDCQTIRIE